MNGKNKNILLIAVLLLSLFIAYKLAFSKTIALRNQYLQAKNESLSNEEVTKKVIFLKQLRKYNDSILQKHKNRTHSSFQNSLLQSINTLSKEYSLSVLGFLEPHHYSKDGANFTNYQISLEGSYENILNLLYKIEEEYKYGKLLSVNFKKKKDYKTGRNFLVVDFILQRVEWGIFQINPPSLNTHYPKPRQKGYKIVTLRYMFFQVFYRQEHLLVLTMFGEVSFLIKVNKKSFLAFKMRFCV